MYLGNAAHAMDRDALQTLGIEALVNCALSCTLTRKPYYPDQWDYLELECVWVKSLKMPRLSRMLSFASQADTLCTSFRRLYAGMT